jgi:hypothetical protein
MLILKDGEMMKLQHEEIAMLENNKVTILLDG